MVKKGRILHLFRWFWSLPSLSRKCRQKHRPDMEYSSTVRALHFPGYVSPVLPASDSPDLPPFLLTKPVFIPFHPMFLNISLLSFTFCTSVRAKIHLVLHFSPGLFTVQIFSL